MESFSRRLRHAVEQETPRLWAIPERAAGERPGDDESWSKKQELGHLIDSAVNNRVRFRKAALEGEYAGPTYDGRGGVDMGGYADAPWMELIGHWETANGALSVLVERIPEERSMARCRIGEAVTLEFLIDDYISHIQHHVDHILGREHLTEYAGAKTGI